MTPVEHVVLPIVYPRLDSFAKVVGAGALLSLVIELVQLPFYTRVTDTNDLMLNVSGVAIGYCLYALFLGLARRGQKAWRPHPRQGRLDAQNS